jgi:hypothetical protein
MIDELEDLVAAFPGEPGRTRCFAHIINLIVKSVIKQFDVPKAKKGEVLGDALEELIVSAGDIELEECVTRESANEDDDLEDDNEEGWVDERAKMSEEDQVKLNEDVQPVRLVLVKVHVLLIGIDVGLVD